MSKVNGSWRDAALKVLQSSNGVMHYTDIADEIIRQKLRSQIGATPANAVNVAIRNSMKNEGKDSPFTQTGRGEYILRATAAGGAQWGARSAAHDEKAEEPAGIISAFDMYWRRNLVKWSAQPKLFGKQRSETKSVDFCEQVGVYLLHDSREIVYVGRTTEQPLGRRLFEHTFDRLDGRWDRFSRFGLREVSENGKLSPRGALGEISVGTAITTLEAVLIEGLEPRQNRKRGDDFRAAEYLQVPDPDIERERLDQALETLRKRI